jgi:hypothetical protein
MASLFSTKMKTEGAPRTHMEKYRRLFLFLLFSSLVYEDERREGAKRCTCGLCNCPFHWRTSRWNLLFFVFVACVD